MSALASLVRVYDRLAQRGEVPVAGYSHEKIGFVVSLNNDGTPAGEPIDLRTAEGRKTLPRTMVVPQWPDRRTSGIAPNFLWDKTAYALGVTAGEGRRTREEHAAFVNQHTEWLKGENDLGLQAFLAFLKHWRPADFEHFRWPEAMKDQNVVFALESERRHRMIHERPAAKVLWDRLAVGGERGDATCLVTGEKGPIARTHPPIKGVWRAQSSGAAIVSFNCGAFTSYGHEQGDNAPVSQAAAFAYTSALNYFLQPNSKHRVQIGDAGVVFWAEAADQDQTAADEATAIFAGLMAVDEVTEASKVGAILAQLRAGRAIGDLRPQLPSGVRFYVLGLAPNAGRLSVRFYFEDDFGMLAERWLRHVERLRIEPTPKDDAPPMWRLLIETAVQRKSENVIPNLAGEWLRAILTGTPYPASLLGVLLMRLRADHDPNPLRVSMLRAVLLNCYREREVPVSLDPANKDSGYLLGRLFAAYEYVQKEALPRLNATIRDQYYGTASATPRAVFPLLQRKATHHLARLRKDSPGRAQWLDERIGQIFELSDPEALFVPTLSAQRQALFAIGYYHQRNEFYRRKDAPKINEETQE